MSAKSSFQFPPRHKKKQPGDVRKGMDVNPYDCSPMNLELLNQLNKQVYKT